MKGWHNGTMKHVHRIYLSLKVRLHHGVLRSIVAWDSWNTSSILSHSHLMCLESPTVHVTPLHGLHADQPGRLQGFGFFKICAFNMEKRSPSLSTAVVKEHQAKPRAVTLKYLKSQKILVYKLLCKFRSDRAILNPSVIVK